MSSSRIVQLAPLAAVALIAAIVAAVFASRAPLETTEGIVQKIYYIHVPSAFAAYLGFLVNVACSAAFLVNGSRRVDRVAMAGAEVGLFFCTLVLISGPIWARPVWGHWWEWEPRLTTTLVLWFMYVGYLVLRSTAPSPAQGARYAAVLAIVAFLMVPVVHKAVDWWGGVHPISKVKRPEALEAQIRTAFLVSVASFQIIAAFLIVLRTHVESARDKAMELLHARDDG